MMPAALGTGLAVLCWQLLVFSLPGLLSLLWPGRRKLTLEAWWLSAVLAAAVQALLGTLWSGLHLPAPDLEPLIWLGISTGLCIGLRNIRISFHRIAQPGWVWVLMLITVLVRLIPAAVDAGLGQSDAYAHLQFGQDLLATGSITNPIYPPAHAWVHTLPARGMGLEPYLLYRFGGAAPALGMILALFFACRRGAGERVAVCAGLLAAACPLFLPLIKTGVGVFANQLGLLFAASLLWSIYRHSWISLLLAMGLAVSVPLMAPDLALPLLLLALLQKRYRLAGILVATGVTGILLVAGRILSRPPEHLTESLKLLAGSEGSVTIAETIKAFVLPGPVPFPVAIQVAVAFMAVTAMSLFLLRRRLTYRSAALLPLLAATAGLQTATGIFQFPAYQRAGWLFFLGLAGVGGLVIRDVSRQLRLTSFVYPLLLLSGLGLFLLPPVHPPQLSHAEDELIRLLRYLRAEPPEEQTDLWTRPFNGFAGRQGDPVPVLMRRETAYRIRSPEFGKTPVLDPRRPAIVILETVPPPVTGNPEHDERVQGLWSLNQALNEMIQQTPGMHPWTPPAGLPLHGLEVWRFRGELPASSPGDNDS